MKSETYKCFDIFFSKTRSERIKVTVYKNNRLVYSFLTNYFYKKDALEIAKNSINIYLEKGLTPKQASDIKRYDTQLTGEYY